MTRRSSPFRQYFDCYLSVAPVPSGCLLATADLSQGIQDQCVAKRVLRLPVSWSRWLYLGWPTVVHDHEEARNLSRVSLYKANFLTNWSTVSVS